MTIAVTQSRRRRAASVALLVAAATVGLSVTIRQPAAAAQSPKDSGAGSAVTVQGTGANANLRVTVGQTQNLGNQTVKITWTGATPPVNSNVPSTVDFLQIMQCWGSDPAGPDRTQCEYGGTEKTNSTLGSRRVSVVHDPNEPLTNTNPPPQGDVYVPFDGADGGSVAGDAATNTYFDQTTSNEIENARTRPNGTGTAYIEVLTGAQSPGLGCGNPVTHSDGSRTGQSCWLVIVPRGSTEVDGSDRSSASQTLESSPLSMTNWDDRLVVPLQFNPVGVACPFGSPEHRIYGTQLAAQAVYRWQPALCDQTGAVYGFSSLGDSLARQQLISGNPNLELVANPVPQSQLPSGVAPVYAPVALSGPAILFNIDSEAFSGAAADNNGTRIESLNLTPRLVAKLLTQSYGLMGGEVVSGATLPQSIFDDPDFLQLNPQLQAPVPGHPGQTDPTKSALSVHPGTILLPSVQTDETSLLWSYVNANPDARAWLDGTPDPWGMVVNPAFKGIALPRPDFPKADLECRPASGSEYCVFDEFPYSNDPLSVARSASRGEFLTRNPNQCCPYPAYPNPYQVSGFRTIFGVSDLPDAALYSLPVASLQNAAGQFVAPDQSSMRAAEAGMTLDQATQTLSLDQTKKVSGAYPLTSVTYAATVPNQLSPKDGTAYANFIRYAVDAGQIPGELLGELPDGYSPLPAPLVARAESAANVIEDDAQPVPSASVSATPPAATRSATKVATAGHRVVTGTGVSPTVGPTSAPVPGVAPASGTLASTAVGLPTPAVAPEPSGAPQLVETARTPSTSAGFARLVPVLVLVLAAIGLGTGFGGPSLLQGLRQLRPLRRRAG